jgi:hypothetical protein
MLAAMHAVAHARSPRSDLRSSVPSALLERARQARAEGFSEVMPGAVSFLHEAGSALNLNPHGSNLGLVDETVDQGDDAGGVGEDLVPLLEALVGGDYN